MAADISVEEQIIVALRQISRAIDLYSRLLLDQCGLTAPQLGTLRAVIAEGPVAPKWLATYLHISQATMAGILRRLEKQCLLHRTPSAHDGRSVNISITAKGRRLATQAPSLLRDRFRAELAKLAATDRREMLKTLQKVATMMGAEDQEVSPFLFNTPVGTGQRYPVKRRSARATS